MDGLIKCMQEKREWREWVKLLWQKAYLWRRFRNQDVTTKRQLAKALRIRLAAMQKAESFAYYADPQGTGCKDKAKLEKRNRRERLMVHSILTDMYNCVIIPNYLGTD